MPFSVSQKSLNDVTFIIYYSHTIFSIKTRIHDKVISGALKLQYLARSFWRGGFTQPSASCSRCTIIISQDIAGLSLSNGFLLYATY